jgi:hypothetical protein
LAAAFIFCLFGKFEIQLELPKLSFAIKQKIKAAAKQNISQIMMSLRFLLIFFGFAHSFAILSKDLQNVVSEKLVPSDLVKMKTVDPNWKGEGIFERITEVAGLFVHRETKEIILETKKKSWMEREVIEKLRKEPGDIKNLIKKRDWDELFLPYSHTNQFRIYWMATMAEIVNVNKRYAYERTPLMRAVEFDDINIVKMLVEKDADVNAKDRNGQTALHRVGFVHDRIEMIKVLLELGADIDATQNQKYTLLMMAAQRMDIDAVKTLLERGANVNMKNIDGMTALHFVAVNTCVKSYIIEVIELLLDFKAEINATDNLGETPLMNSVRRSRNTIDAVGMLLEHGARGDIKNRYGWTAIDIAEHKLSVWYREQIIELLKAQQKQNE